MNQKGLATVPVILAGLLLLIIGAFAISKLGSKPVSVPNTPIESTSSGTTNPEPKLESSPSTKPQSQSDCDNKKDICFENKDLKVTIYEGYLEDADNWVAELVLTGKGSGGFELKLAEFPKEFSVRSPVQDFKGASQKIYVRLQKNVTKKGTYKGIISVRSYLTNKTTTANLIINYLDWNDRLIHTDPLEKIHDCKVDFSGWPENKYMNCGDLESTSKVRFYYYGKHSKIEVRTEAEKDSKRYLTLKRELNSATTFDVENVVTLYINLGGFPDNKDLGNEPSGTYKGYFVFIDQVSQKEIYRTPYTLKVTGEK